VIIDGELLVALEGEPLVDVGAGEIVLFRETTLIH